MRVLFNSLCANASVNHLHWHLYYLDFRMLLECVVSKNEKKIFKLVYYYLKSQHYNLYKIEISCINFFQPLKNLMDSLYTLEDFPAKGYCIKYSSFEKQSESINKFVSYAYDVVSCLQKNEIAHNIYITRSKTDSNKENFDDIRIYIWARAPSYGSKNTEDFIIAACEVFGHLPIRSKSWDFLKILFLYPYLSIIF